MGTHLRETLRSLCLKTEWKYAVFWRLKHRDRKILTWEDAYCNNHELPNHSENMCYIDTLVDFHHGGYQQDLLGLALAKMTYAVYPLGEGIIGKVAASGTHQWNFADRPASGSWSSSETIAVVAVTPLGVVQLGSLDTVFEDLNLVTRIKDIFCSLQSSSMRVLPKPIQCTMKTTPILSELPTKRSDEEIINDCLGILDEVVISIKPDTGSNSLPFFGKLNNIPHVLPLSDLCPKEAVEVVDKQVGIEPLTLWGDESAQFIQHWRGIVDLEHQKHVQMKLLNNKKCGEDTNGWKDICVSSRRIHPPASHNSCAENAKLNNDMLESGVHIPFRPVDSLVSMAWEEVKSDRMIYLQNEGLHAPETFEMQLGEKSLEQKLKLQTEIKHVDTNTLLRFSAGCEVHEALNPAYVMQEQHHSWIEAERGETAVSIEPPEGMGISQFMSECGSDNLLEAVVANACVGFNSVKSESSFCETSQSVVTTEKSPQVPIRAKRTCISAGGPNGESFVVEDSNYQLTSTCHLAEAHIRSRKELSSKTLSTCHEQSGRQVEPAKVSKKRARPRDRQLIQDRIKKLRGLVPNGLKCSIDLLLGHTIKHILFLQSVTEHAEKLRKCAESKVHDKGVDLLGSYRHEHGSSWALELGSQTLRPIVVENLNMNGQMLVEMLCEECSLFFDIGEVLIGLGLTILRGATEIRGKKTWACFVVEGEKGFHRMDILWSLMLLLQPKTII
ncbi:transcription factor EMB1444-like isoform X2 [Telopea speciosissima]|uniref:transcription factor EMB1444-like isoform X2 n=1 Tax=Telopea speciosissima TaxID=54955 RepID=UPI001CC4A438|nr:transcription factor EMB1444-like isoform X2 [Telopea speciosissima]